MTLLALRIRRNGTLIFCDVVLMLGYFSDHFGSGGPDGVRGFFGKHQAGFHSGGTGPLHFLCADHTYTVERTRLTGPLLELQAWLQEVDKHLDK